MKKSCLFYGIFPVSMFPGGGYSCDIDVLKEQYSVSLGQIFSTGAIMSAYHLNEIFGENVSTNGTARSVLKTRKWECAVSFARKTGCSG